MIWEILFWLCALLAAGCFVFAIFGGIAFLFRRPLEKLTERIVDLSDALDGEGRRR